MKFAVTRLRCRGLKLDEREALQAKPAVGDLRVEHAQDAELKRPTRIARLVRQDRSIDADALPPLMDVALIAMGNSGMTLAGFERVQGCCYAQSWLVREA